MLKLQFAMQVFGLGLFSAKHASLWLEPANGLCVRRAESSQAHAISPALALGPLDSSWAGLPPQTPLRNTTLRLPDREIIATVEHALSAIAGLGAWNTCLVLSEGPECPIADGSALAFTQLVRRMQAQCAASSSPLPQPLVVREPITLRDGPRALIEALPLAAGEQPSMTYELDYGEAARSAPLLKGAATWDCTPASYLQSIAPARTFSLLAEAKAAQAMGLFRHLSPADMLVLDDAGNPVSNTLRFADEPARHKLLDLIGDLALLGRPIAARIRAVASGHALAAKFARELALAAQAYDR